MITTAFSYIEEGEIAVAANKTFQIAARVTEEEKDALVKYCEDNELNMAQVIRKAVKEYISKKENN